MAEPLRGVRIEERQHSPRNNGGKAFDYPFTRGYLDLGRTILRLPTSTLDESLLTPKLAATILLRVSTTGKAANVSVQRAPRFRGNPLERFVGR